MTRRRFGAAAALLLSIAVPAFADNSQGPYQPVAPGELSPPSELVIPNGNGGTAPPSASLPLPVAPMSAYLYTDLGNCQLAAISSATALSSCSGGIPSGATTVLITVEGEPIRWRGDNTAPTASVGNLQPIGQFTYAGQPLSHFAAIPATGNATLDVEFFK